MSWEITGRRLVGNKYIVKYELDSDGKWSAAVTEKNGTRVIAKSTNPTERLARTWCSEWMERLES